MLSGAKLEKSRPRKSNAQRGFTPRGNGLPNEGGLHVFFGSRSQTFDTLATCTRRPGWKKCSCFMASVPFARSEVQAGKAARSRGAAQARSFQR